MKLPAHRLWRLVRRRVDHSDEAIRRALPFLQHGSTDGFVVWRYGSWVPEVSLPSDWLMVGRGAMEALRGTGAELRRASSLVLVDPDCDWRELGETLGARLANVLRRYDGKLVRPVSKLPYGTSERPSSDCYLVTPSQSSEGVLLPGDDTSYVVDVAWGRGVHAVSPHGLCVEDQVRDVLMAHDTAGLISFEDVPMMARPETP